MLVEGVSAAGFTADGAYESGFVSALQGLTCGITIMVEQPSDVINGTVVVVSKRVAATGAKQATAPTPVDEVQLIFQISGMLQNKQAFLADTNTTSEAVNAELAATGTSPVLVAGILIEEIVPGASPEPQNDGGGGGGDGAAAGGTGIIIGGIIGGAASAAALVLVYKRKTKGSIAKKARSRMTGLSEDQIFGATEMATQQRKNSDSVSGYTEQKGDNGMHLDEMGVWTNPMFAVQNRQMQQDLSRLEQGRLTPTDNVSSDGSFGDIEVPHYAPPMLDTDAGGGTGLQLEGGNSTYDVLGVSGRMDDGAAGVPSLSTVPTLNQASGPSASWSAELDDLDSSLFAGVADPRNSNPVVPRVGQQVTISAPAAELARKAAAVFDRLDQDGGGSLSRNELTAALGISKIEAKALMVEVKNNLGADPNDDSLTKAEFIRSMQLSLEARDNRLSDEELEKIITKRGLKRYRNIFDQIDVDGGGTISLEELAEDMPGIEELTDVIQSIVGDRHELSFMDFARLLHQSEKGSGGRAMISLVEETEEGRELIEGIRHEHALNKRSFRKLSASEKTKISPELLEVWTTSAPGAGGMASMDNITYALNRAQQQGSIAVSDEDLMFIIEAVGQQATDGLIDLDGFWHVMAPMIQPDVVYESGMVDSRMSADSADSDYGQAGFAASKSTSTSASQRVPRLPNLQKAVSVGTMLTAQDGISKSAMDSAMGEALSHTLPADQLQTYTDVFNSWQPTNSLADHTMISFAITSARGTTSDAAEATFFANLGEMAEETAVQPGMAGGLGFEEFVFMVREAEATTAALFGADWKVTMDTLQMIHI